MEGEEGREEDGFSAEEGSRKPVGGWITVWECWSKGGRVSFMELVRSYWGAPKGPGTNRVAADKGKLRFFDRRRIQLLIVRFYLAVRALARGGTAGSMLEDILEWHNSARIRIVIGKSEVYQLISDR